LQTVNGGLLRAARSLDEHVRLLADSLGGEGGGDEKAARFAEGFVRPFGAAVTGHAQVRRRSGTRGGRPCTSGRTQWNGGALRLPLYPMVAVIAVHLRTQLWRKHTRNKSARSSRRGGGAS
jgi:hypothetical protein